MQIDFNQFITRQLTYLQYIYIVIHACNSLFSTTSDAHYNYKVFSYDECLHATIKYATH